MNEHTLIRFGAEWLDINLKVFDVYQNEDEQPRFKSPYTGELLEIIRRVSEDIIIVG